MAGAETPLRVGIIGLGPRGDAYANAFRMEPGANVAARSTSDTDTAGNRGDVATAAEIVAAPAVDAIVLTDPDAERASARAREALNRGKLVVWPAAPADRVLLDGLADDAARSGGALSIPNELRYLPSIRRLTESILGGDCGRLLSVFMAWRTRRTTLKDPLRSLGLPLIDLLLWCVEGPYTRGHVTGGEIDEGRGLVEVIVRHESGLVATIEIAAALPQEFELEDDVLIEVLGDTAAVRAEPFNQAITIVRSGGIHQRVAWHRDAAIPIVAELMAARRAGGAYPGLVADQREALELLDRLQALAVHHDAGALTSR